uniref:Uncharacterized protein n=1 Tax=Romanomermis culicivorax TaxID=13658 RepID=A0A915K0G0_ROMCU
MWGESSSIPTIVSLKYFIVIWEGSPGVHGIGARNIECPGFVVDIIYKLRGHFCHFFIKCGKDDLQEGYVMVVDYLMAAVDCFDSNNNEYLNLVGYYNYIVAVVQNY